MKFNRLFSISILLMSLLLFSCKHDDCPEPSDPSRQSLYSLPGSYNGIFRTITEDNVIEESKRVLVVGTDIINYEGGNYVLANIESYVYIIKLYNLTNFDNVINGKVNLYEYSDEVILEGKEIAGDGSFSYKDGKVTLIWTASTMNGGWSIKFQSE